MQYTTLGQTGLLVSRLVSRLAFGTMTVSAGEGSNTPLAETAAMGDTMVGQALDAGVNFFDTADGYAAGEAETLLGAALRGRRDEVVVATKTDLRGGGAPTQPGVARRHILQAVDGSLKRLGTDWVDAYAIDGDDTRAPLEEIVYALDFIVRDGKVRYIGFVDWPAWRAAAALEIQKANGLAPFTYGQASYSLLGREAERDVIPMVRRYGLGLAVWGGLASGVLRGEPGAASPVDLAGRHGGTASLPPDPHQGLCLAESLRVIAAERGATIAQIAVAWLLARPAVASVILRAAKPGQLAETLGAADLKLTPGEIAGLDAATALPLAYPEWLARKLAERPSAPALVR